MDPVTRRGANAVAVLLAASGIGILSLGWALTSAGSDTVVGAEVIPPEASSPEASPSEETPPTPRVERDPPPFADSFEQGLDRWRVVGSAVTTEETASRGSRSATLTSPACRGDAFSRRVPVDAGATYRLR